MFFAVNDRFKYFYTHRGWIDYLSASNDPVPLHREEDLLRVEHDELLLLLEPCPEMSSRSHLLCAKGIACIDVATMLNTLAVKEIT